MHRRADTAEQRGEILLADGSTSADGLTQSRIDHTDRLIACLEAAGLTVTRLNPVSFSSGSPALTEKQHREIVARCHEEVGPAPERTYDAETAVRIYTRWLETVECIRAAGYESGPVPSKEAFVEDFVARRPSWHPYGGSWSDALTIAELDRLRSQCPSWVG